jgi:hypothetical protein
MQGPNKPSPRDVANIIACSGSKHVLGFEIDPPSSIRLNLMTSISMTRNILLQVPNKNDGSVICNLEEGCNGDEGCSSHGYCQDSTCLCDTKFWGHSCK